ncbi:MAG: CYTH domain-containing protein [Lachnospiraceae bacterium]|nr:CYTH domain-containing protein [Lachnospiraceae bacterium]
MEIERKFKINKLPDNLEDYRFHMIEQAYLNIHPVIRIRQQDEEYYLTYKGQGLLVREEYNLPLTKEAYEHLKTKADGNIISKKRYLIPLDSSCFLETALLSEEERNTSLTIELDVFDPPFYPLVLAEVEFPSEAAAYAFLPPSWLGEDVTENPAYHNSNMSRQEL